MNRVAIMQGRLLPEKTDIYQVFSASHWKDEMVKAGRFGYDGLEALYDRDGVCESLFAAGAFAGQEGAFVSVCADALAHIEFADFDRYKACFMAVLEFCASLDISILVLPFVERNECGNASELSRVVEKLTAVAGDAFSICAVESNLPAYALMDVARENPFGICYDLGNARAAGRVPEDEIVMLGSMVRHVHIKDRLQGGPNVPLGQGDVDFTAAAEALRSIGYCGDFALEAAYGQNSLGSARNYRSQIKDWMGY